MTVKLFTKDGSFVHEQTIPPFRDPPDVIVWGDRIFAVPEAEGPVARHLAAAGDDDQIYEEAFAYALPAAELLVKGV